MRGGAALSSFTRSHGRLGGASPNLCHPRNPRLCLRFDRDFRFDRVRDEALLVRGMIHLVELLRGRLFIAGELRLLPENNPRDR